MGWDMELGGEGVVCCVQIDDGSGACSGVSGALDSVTELPTELAGSSARRRAHEMRNPGRLEVGQPAASLGFGRSPAPQSNEGVRPLRLSLIHISEPTRPY